MEEDQDGAEVKGLSLEPLEAADQCWPTECCEGTVTCIVLYGRH